MQALGKHILAEFYGCRFDVINDCKNIKKLCMRAAQESGATVVGSSFHEFNPQGVSGVVVIAESHLSVHTWPEYQFASMDIFLKASSEPSQSLPLIKKYFHPTL